LPLSRHAWARGESSFWGWIRIGAITKRNNIANAVIDAKHMIIIFKSFISQFFSFQFIAIRTLKMLIGVAICFSLTNPFIWIDFSRLSFLPYGKKFSQTQL
jgi:hypothetical protein